MSIRSDVEVLATHEGRTVGTAGHEVARRYLLERLETIGVKPYLSQGFEAWYQSGGQDLYNFGSVLYPKEDLDDASQYGTQEFCNLLAVLPGEDASLAPVLLGAHYDAVEGTPGADDNAAAVAVLLEVVGILGQERLPRSVLLALFDAEEPPNFLSPSMGSIRFFEDQLLGPVHAAVIMDLVGHDVPIPGLEDLLFVVGLESNEGLGEVIQSCPVDPGIRIVPTLNRYVGDLSDHHVFRQNGVPYLFLTCATWQHYHRPTDTPDKLNYKKAEAIARYLARLIMQISGNPLAGAFEGYDSTDIELGFIRDTLGPVLSGMGVPTPPENRQEISQLVSMMMVQFGL